MDESGLIGLGAIAYKIDSKSRSNKNAISYLSAIKQLDGVVISHICDKDSEALENFSQAFGSPVRKYRDYIEIIADANQFDLLCILTSDETHFEILSHAIEANVTNILCEKPFVLHQWELHSVMELYRRSSSKVIINHSLRWDPMVQSMKSLVSDSKYVQVVRGTYVKGFMHNGIHILDLIVWFYGQPKQILKLRESVFNGYSCIDLVLFYDQFIVNINCLDDKFYTEAELDIVVGANRYVLGCGTYWFKHYKSIPSSDIPGYNYLSPEAVLHETNQLGSMVDVLVDVVNFVKEKKEKKHQLCSIDDAYLSMRLAFQIANSKLLQVESFCA